MHSLTWGWVDQSRVKLFNQRGAQGHALECLHDPELLSRESGMECSFLGLLVVRGDKTVHVHDSFFGQTLSHGDGSVIDGGLELGSSDESSSLELGKAVADTFTGSVSLVLGSGSVSLLSSEVLTETLDSDLLSHVELVADGGGTDVEPVLRVWGKLLEASGLSVLGPLCVLNNIKLEI